MFGVASLRVRPGISGRSTPRAAASPWFGLPNAAATLLEADRERLGLGRYEYLLHVVFERSLAVREKGPGFDAPATGERRKR